MVEKLKRTNRTVIGTCSDGTARTIVAWYAKGGRSNFAAWGGENRFVMTGVLEEYETEDKEQEDMKLIDRYTVKYQGYGTQHHTKEGHIVVPIDRKVCTTLTTMCMTTKYVVEVYETEDKTKQDE